VEKLAPTRIRSPDRPDRSQSLYRLSYLATQNKMAEQDYGSRGEMGEEWEEKKHWQQ
jgi:hypothetical protein